MKFIPARRWLVAGGALALVAPLGAVTDAVSLDLLLLLNGVWFLALLVDAARVPGPGAVRVEREAPPAFSAGRALPVRYRWHNLTSRTLHALVREDPPAPLRQAPEPIRPLHLAPAEGVVESRTYCPARRGKGRGGDFAVRLLGPWGLVWRQHTVPAPWDVTVFPALTGMPRRGLQGRAARRRESGLRAARRPGEGRLFEGLIDWVPGDDPRRMDWKASARRQKLMVRQYEDERRQHLMLAIDTGRLLTAEVGGISRLDRVVDAALQLAHAAVAHDDNIGLLVFADTIQAYLPPARGRRALGAVAEALAGVEGTLVEPDYPLAFRYLARKNRKRALTMLFTDVIDRTASDALLTHVATLRPRHLPVAVTLRDPDLEGAATARPATVAAAYERAAAEELLAAREAALAAMRARGVVVLDVPPSAAAQAAVEQYHQLKRRGVL